jgi:hypothetical protein
MRVTREELKEMKNNGYEKWARAHVPTAERRIKVNEFEVKQAERRLESLKDSLERDKNFLAVLKEELRIMEELD